MPITAAQFAYLHDAGELASLCLELRVWLANVKRSRDEEIRTYPTPIPRCDAQFNHIYEQRARLAQLLDRLDAVLRGSHAPDDFTIVLAQIVAAPAFCGDAEERELRARAAAALSIPGSARNSI
jgi:hypothetical protein